MEKLKIIYSHLFLTRENEPGPIKCFLETKPKRIAEPPVHERVKGRIAIQHQPRQWAEIVENTVDPSWIGMPFIQQSDEVKGEDTEGEGHCSRAMYNEVRHSIFVTLDEGVVL